MKNQVEGDAADRAIFLFNKMLENSGIDVNTGKVDIGVLQGRPRSEISKMDAFVEAIRALEGTSKEPVPEQELDDEIIKTEKFRDED